MDLQETLWSLPIGGGPDAGESPRQLLGASLLNVAANRDGGVERRGPLAADETATDDGALQSSIQGQSVL